MTQSAAGPPAGDEHLHGAAGMAEDVVQDVAGVLLGYFTDGGKRAVDPGVHCLAMARLLAAASLLAQPIPYSRTGLSR